LTHYPSNGLRIAKPQREGIRTSLVQATIVPLALACWLAFANFPMLALSTDAYVIEPVRGLSVLDNLSMAWLRQFQSIGFLIFVSSLLFYTRSELMNSPFITMRRSYQKLMSFCILAMAFLSVQSTTPAETFLYCVFFFFALWVSSCIWQTSPAITVATFTVSFYATAAFILAAFLIHGWPDDRMVGGIHPNNFAATAFAAMVLGCISGGKKRWLGMILSFSVAIIVSSRYVLLSSTAFVFAYAILSPRRIRGGFPLLLLGLCISAAMIIFGLDVIEHVFAVNDPNRGFGSGLTGRMDMWQLGMLDVANNPFFGVGFRAKGEASGIAGAHNAFLSLAVQVGVIVAPLLLFAVLSISVVTMLRCRAGFFVDIQVNSMARSVGPAILAILIGAFFETQIFNLGDSFGILLILCLGFPYYERVPPWYNRAAAREL
jgi:hypothetical protein